MERNGHGLVLDEPLAPEERAREALLMGLRLAEGVDLARFNVRTERTIAESVDANVLQQCVAAGYLIDKPNQLVATREGRIRLNSLLAALVV